MELGAGCLHVSSIPNAMLGFLFASIEGEGKFPNSLALVDALKPTWMTSLTTKYGQTSSVLMSNTFWKLIFWETKSQH